MGSGVWGLGFALNLEGGDLGFGIWDAVCAWGKKGM